MDSYSISVRLEVRSDTTVVDDLFSSDKLADSACKCGVRPTLSRAAPDPIEMALIQSMFLHEPVYEGQQQQIVPDSDKYWTN